VHGIGTEDQEVSPSFLDIMGQSTSISRMSSHFPSSINGSINAKSMEIITLEAEWMPPNFDRVILLMSR
jgi:hypothetical protein